MMGAAMTPAQSGRRFLKTSAMPSEMSYRSRRHFLKGGASLWIVGVLSVTTRPRAALAAGIPAGGDKGQGDWRFCNKCNGIFYDGYPQKGRCPAGGGHVAQGFNFVLSHPGDRPSGGGTIPPSPTVK